MLPLLATLLQLLLLLLLCSTPSIHASPLTHPSRGPRIAGPDAEQRCLSLSRTFNTSSIHYTLNNTFTQYYPTGSNPSLELLAQSLPPGVLPSSPSLKALLEGVGPDFDLSLDDYGKNTGPEAKNGPLGGLPAFCRFGAYIKTSNLTQVFAEVWMPLAANGSIDLAAVNATDYPTSNTPIELDEKGGFIKGPPYLVNNGSAAPPSSSAPPTNASPSAGAPASSSAPPADAASSPSSSPPLTPRSSSHPTHLTGTQLLGSGDGWNGRLLYIGNGGLRGAVPFTDLKANMARYRFAVVGSNTGHWSTTGGATWINGTQINETLLDWGKRSTHVSRQLGEEVIAAFYGAEPRRAYYTGCSNGGKPGLASAMYYPKDFDGILAGAPGINFNRMNVGQIHTQKVHRIASVGQEAWFSQVVLQGPVHQTILDQCDHLDGVVDGVISAPKRCKPDFRAALLCGRAGAKYGASNETCLTEAQIINLEELYRPTILNGTFIYPPFAYGAEGQASTLKGTQAKAGNFFSLAVRRQPDLSAEATGNFSYWDSITAQDVEEGDREGQNWVSYKTDLSEAFSAGSKIMVYHGLADAFTISPYSTENYIKAVAANSKTRGPLDEHMRFYPVPGMHHCRDGPGAWHFGGPTQNDAGNRPYLFRTDYDMLLSLVAWVERGHKEEYQVGAAYGMREKVIPEEPAEGASAGGGSSAEKRKRSSADEVIEWMGEQERDATGGLPLDALAPPLTNSTSSPSPNNSSVPAAPAPPPQPKEPLLPTVYSSYHYGLRFTRKLCPWPKEAKYVGKKGEEGAMGEDAYKWFDIYAFFLLWALLQERLTTTPYVTHAHDGIALIPGEVGTTTEYFSSPLLLQWGQAVASTGVATAYLLAVGRRNRGKGGGETIWERLGLAALLPSGAQRIEKQVTPPQPKANGHVVASSSSQARISPLLTRYLLISFLQSTSSQLGLHSLSHGISYPTLTLAKSCKLVPVLLMNLLLYRRHFPRYKYLVVGMVTAGISAFMLGGQAKKSSSNKGGAAGDSLIGVALLVLNLVLDGATNSTQDEVFHRWTVSGPQMMLVMNTLSSLLLGASLVLPLPAILGGTHDSSASGTVSGSELNAALSFISRHPSVLRDILSYAMAGALGQVAIFETLQRFGSLTLVSITVTRKLFTMLLSLIVYSHRLTAMQWGGVGVVFVGLGVEAREKRREAGKKRGKQSMGLDGDAGANGGVKTTEKKKVT
ncbi:UAA-domain-containing protein [Jaminaea rosea]|uniref:Carboxylic ester hydrolase n=1 Tax=Jaminaea rosea TaxID=1569628 RepID=A0A316UGG8_9BASI|nr:UAA-domain-containing protein [Jaminaea rosea]PWN24362.1 UAA-domain-containing protein [Jaminaea rosea]